MAAHAVPGQASSVPIGEAWWFRFLVRTVLALLAFWTLSFAADRYVAFGRDASTNFRFDNSLWLAWAGATIAAGLLFGLATWVPFTKVRFLSSRLLLAGLALIPVTHFWWVLIQHHGGSGGWLGRSYWFDSTPIQFVSAVFGGVAIASGFRAQRSMPAPGVSLSVHSSPTHPLPLTPSSRGSGGGSPEGRRRLPGGPPARPEALLEDPITASIAPGSLSSMPQAEEPTTLKPGTVRRSSPGHS